MDISSLLASYGGSSGIDSLYSLANQFVAANTPLVSSTSQALAAINQQNSSYQTQISDYGKLQSALSTFQAAASALTLPSAFNAVSASSSNPTVLSATADNTAAAGSFNLQVSALAQSQSLLSAGQASPSAAIGSGAATTLSFQFGTTNGTTFTPNANQAIQTVTIDSSNNSLQGIAGAINAAQIGVNATVAYDGTSYHLQIVSANTGASNSLSLTVNGDASLQSLLSYTPGGTQALTQTQAAQDAQFTLNGVASSSSSNTVSGAVQGVTFNLLGTGSATVGISPNTNQTASNIGNFVAAYNTLQSTFNTLAQGDLQNDPLLQSIQSQVNAALGSISSTGSPYDSLAQLGITTQQDGTLAVNSTTLQNALTANPSAVAAVFTNNGQGVADQLSSLALNLTDPAGGVIASEISSVSGALRSSQNTQQDLTYSYSQQTQNLQSQYTYLTGLLSSLQSSSQFFTGQSSLLGGQTDLLSSILGQSTGAASSVFSSFP
ncbi:MAG: flagellar filament capping protein FliD [Burkholderiales bacterium]